MTTCAISLLCILIGLLNIVSSSAPPKVQDEADQKESMLCLSGRVIKGEIIDNGSDSVKLQLTLSQEIKNVGGRKVLLLRREPVVVERKIITISSEAGSAKYLYLLHTLPSIERPWNELQEPMDRSTPPPDVIQILSPGETWTFVTDEWFYLSKKGDSTSKPWSEIRKASPVLLQLTLEMWSDDIERFDDRDKLKFSRVLQHRWRGIGNLQLEDLKSDLIILDLSSFTIKTPQS